MRGWLKKYRMQVWIRLVTVMPNTRTPGRDGEFERGMFILDQESKKEKRQRGVNIRFKHGTQQQMGGAGSQERCHDQGIGCIA